MSDYDDSDDDDNGSDTDGTIRSSPSLLSPVLAPSSAVVAAAAAAAHGIPTNAVMNDERQCIEHLLDKLEKLGVYLSAYGNCGGVNSLVPVDEYHRQRRQGTLFDWQRVSRLISNPAALTLQRREAAQVGQKRPRHRATSSSKYITCYGPMVSSLMRSVVLERDHQLDYVANGEIIIARLALRMKTRFLSHDSGKLSVDAICYPPPLAYH